jgi:type VI secretion system secreted protein Hcp
MAVDAFLKIDGVKGESVIKGHAGEIDILSWSWGMSQSGTTHAGTGGGAGKVNVQDLSFTHFVDSSTPNIIQACCSGKHFGEAIITLRKAGEKPLEYIVITMTDVIITSVSTGGSQGEERVTENVTLNFAKYKYGYQPQDKTGGAKGGVMETEYNIAENA